MDDPIQSHPAYLALQPLVSRQTTASDATKSHITKAVSEVSELVRKASSPEVDDAVGDAVWDTWDALFTLAGETPHEQQQGLVDFLYHLRRTTVSGADGDALTDGGVGEVWTDLPSFGWCARDLWNFNVRKKDMTEEKLATINNRAALLARLTARVDEGKPKESIDYSLYGLWAMRDAFEEAPRPGEINAPAIKNAAIWLRYCGKRLRDMSLAGRDMPARTGFPGDLYTEKEWKGFARDRWSLWEDGFRAALGDKELDAEAQELIQSGLQSL